MAGWVATKRSTWSKEYHLQCTMATNRRKALQPFGDSKTIGEVDWIMYTINWTFSLKPSWSMKLRFRGWGINPIGVTQRHTYYVRQSARGWLDHVRRRLNFQRRRGWENIRLESGNDTPWAHEEEDQRGQLLVLKSGKTTLGLIFTTSFTFLRETCKGRSAGSPCGLWPNQMHTMVLSCVVFFLFEGNNGKRLWRGQLVYVGWSKSGIWFTTKRLLASYILPLSWFIGLARVPRL
jgi:hypothetical protein